MENGHASVARWIVWKLYSFLQKCILNFLCVGPIPSQIAFIMDGNRRYARKHQLMDGGGHHAGFLPLMLMVRHCYKLGVKYATAYTFSIENFKRRPEEVEYIMEVIKEKIELLIKTESLMHYYKIKVQFSGNLELISEPVRNAAGRLVAATSIHSNMMLILCVAYTSTDEIVHAMKKSCEEKCDTIQKPRPVHAVVNDHISLVEIENQMYMAIAPDPDILIRTSGENRLSNFLLWQNSFSNLCMVPELWPEISLGHLFWAVMEFQQKHSYLEKKKKKKKKKKIV